MLKPGRSYEVGLWADTASTADTSFSLNLQAGANIFTVLGVNYQYYVATQAKWTGTPASKFASFLQAALTADRSWWMISTSAKAT